MKWLLDTNVLIHAARGKPAAVRRRLRETSPDDICISAVTVAELLYGAERSPDPAARRSAWREYFAPYAILPFDQAAAERHARLRFAMRHEPIGERDLIIAATALSYGLVVVTANRREFARVPELEVEDWSADG
jgi:tRNA(fMet)-specific endonuclease VapC